MRLRLSTWRDHEHGCTVLTLHVHVPARWFRIDPEPVTLVWVEVRAPTRRDMGRAEMAPARDYVAEVSIQDSALELDRDPGGLFARSMRRLETQIMQSLSIPPALVAPRDDARFRAMAADTITHGQPSFVAGEELFPGDPVLIRDGKLYNADGLYHRVPEHLRPLLADIRIWEKELLADPRSAPIYADWLDEHGGWDVRTNQLRAAATA